MSNKARVAARRTLRVETLEARQLLAGDTYLVNFQNDEATTPTRYVRDTGELFADRGNGLSYGWTSDHTDQARERSASADQRLDTLIHFEAGQSWEIALDNGEYEVTVAVGDPGTDDGVHTINVEGVNYWNAEPDTTVVSPVTMTVTVSDGRLTIDQGAAAEKATRINYAHIVGLAAPGNAAPTAPTITEPELDDQITNPADVHMESVGFSDTDGDTHKSSDWEIWTVGPGSELVWQTLGIEGVEKVHTHLGDGIFQNSLAGETELAENTDYLLRNRYRDSAGAVSGYSTRLFQTGQASTLFPLQLRDISETPNLTWTIAGGAAIELPVGPSLLSPADSVIAIDLDGGSNYPGAESPDLAVDGTLAKHLNFGEVNSGFIVTPAVGPTVVTSFQLTTANDAEERDPNAWELYGTDDDITSTDNSTGTAENWTLIDSGAVALPGARDTPGPVVNVSNATTYRSYRMVFTGVKNAGAANSMQIAEAQFFGQSGFVPGPAIFSPGDAVLGVDLDGFGSASPAGEEPENAIDSSALTKYLNFGKGNSGLIVTPSAGSTTVASFQLTTANDAPDRDPTSWEIYGTNDPITSANNSGGNAENWTLIDSESIDLPTARLTPSGIIPIDNTAGAFTSYRIVFPTISNPLGPIADSMQIAEVQFFEESTGEESIDPSLTIEAGDTGEALLQIKGSEGPGNEIIDSPPIADHSSIRIVIESGSQNLILDRTDLAFTGDDQPRTVFLPTISLAPGQRLDLWVDSAGSTYFGAEGQTEPDFSSLARAATLDIPFIATKPGFVIEEVGANYRLPVNIAFVPDPGPNPDDPLYYVTELYGSIQVVTRDGTKQEFATGLLDYNPQGPISGSGEQGLTGIAVQRDESNPDIYHLYVGMLADNGDPPGGSVHYPKVERITSLSGGLAIDSRTVLLNMQPETQGQSHQISNITLGPDDKLYVHNGDGFDASTALDLDQFRGKVLRMNLDGSAPDDNPFYNAGDGVNARDYVFAYGLRNPFGGAWRASDGQHYEVENGPSIDRFAKVERGSNLGWNGSNASMQIGAIYNWSPATAPVNITFVQDETFAGSQFPADMRDHAFVSESGPTYATGPQANGKRITEFALDANGDLVSGPESLIDYVGTGKSSVVGLAAGPDGLYFSELYEDTGEGGPTGVGARLYRVRYVNPLEGDYDIDGDVDRDDYDSWRSTYGSNLLLAADGNGDGLVDTADYTVWRDAFDLAAQSRPTRLSLVPTTEPAPPSTYAAVPVPPDAVARELLPIELALAVDGLPSRQDRFVRSQYDPIVRQQLPLARDALLLLPSQSSRGAFEAAIDEAFIDRDDEESGHEPDSRLLDGAVGLREGFE